MPIYSLIKRSLVSGATLLLLTGGAQALDASKLIQKDTNSNTIFQLFFGFMNEGKENDAVDVLKYAAEQGNSAAQWKLARLYHKGEGGVDRDQLAAFRMYEKIAAQYPYARPNTPNWQFSADALVALGNYYRKGIAGTVVGEDRGKALMMYTTAAMVFRHPSGHFQLGRMQIEDDNGFGQGTLGVRNLNKAYKKGHVGAEALLGYAHFEGVHVKRDVVQGLIMLGNAKQRAIGSELEWIRALHDEAFSLARPGDRAEATRQINGFGLGAIPNQ
ncbi:MAG: tetratricopeptide repeat protein [Pseudomonadota bacterium]